MHLYTVTGHIKKGEGTNPILYTINETTLVKQHKDDVKKDEIGILCVGWHKVYHIFVLRLKRANIGSVSHKIPNQGEFININFED